jgi:HK97 family phage major capsid protein
MAQEMIDRTGATALIPTDYAREISQGVAEQSAVMRLARRLPNMTTRQTIMPVLETLVTAGFVNGDTSRKPTSKLTWGNKTITAEELAVIVPIPEAVLDDSDYDIWGEVRPRIMEAMGVAFDAAVLFGTNKPASWPTGLVAQAVAAGNSVDQSVAVAAGNDLYDQLLGAGGVISLVEADGYMVDGHVADITMRAQLRGLRDDSGNGQPIFLRSMQEGGQYELDGAPIYFPRNGAWAAATALLVSGDWSNLVYAMRQDLTYKILTEAVIQDVDGSIAYNLAQQDMVALRAVMRVGWQASNPINRMNATAGTRFPFAALVP